MTADSPREENAPREGAPVFGPAFQAELEALLVWRRDVRRFRRDPLPPGMLERLLGLAELAPSVGLSQPWRFVRVASAERRALVRANFESANAEALADYSGSRAALYARLKLSGLDDAPEQLAVFCESAPEQGHGLGRRTMPETLQYSTVCAVHTLWLAARALGIGVGWVSILEPMPCAATWRCRKAGASSHTSASAIPRKSTTIRSWPAAAGRNAARRASFSSPDRV